MAAARRRARRGDSTCCDALVMRRHLTSVILPAPVTQCVHEESISKSQPRDSLAKLSRLSEAGEV